MNKLIGKPIYGEFIKLDKDGKIPIKPQFEIFEPVNSTINEIHKSSLHREYVVNSVYLVSEEVIERIRKYS